MNETGKGEEKDRDESGMLPDKSDNLSEREELLNSFLDRLAPQNESWGNPNFEEEGLELIPTDLSEYPIVRVPTHIEKKIHELKKISESIEKRLVNLDAISDQDYDRFKVNYAAALNKEQLAATVTTEKPILVIAGAGSGKTRVIVHRVSYLIEKGVNPRSILLLTFTRKAAQEMLDRVQSLLQDKSVGNVTGGTFHSFSSYVLRKYSKLIGLPPNFTIIDSADSEDIVDLIRTELKFNKKDKKFPRKQRIYDIISYSRNRRESIATVVKENYSGLEEFIQDIELIYKGYTQYKQMSLFVIIPNHFMGLCAQPLSVGS